MVGAGGRVGRRLSGSVFFFNDTATIEIYTLSLHDALPIFVGHLQQRGESPVVIGEITKGTGQVHLVGGSSS